MHMQSDAGILLSLVAVIFTTNKTIQSKEIHSGILELTNQHLLWFARRGFLSKTELSSFEIDQRI
jgi:hypothetical protein